MYRKPASSAPPKRRRRPPAPVGLHVHGPPSGRPSHPSEISAGLPTPHQQERLTRLTPRERAAAIRAVRAYTTGAGAAPGQKSFFDRPLTSFIFKPPSERRQGLRNLERAADVGASHVIGVRPSRITKSVLRQFAVQGTVGAIRGPGGFGPHELPGEPALAEGAHVRPRTRAEAEARLAELEAAQEKFHKALEGKYKSVMPEEQRRYNQLRGTAKKAQGGAKRVAGGSKALRANLPQGTVSDAFMQRAIDELTAKHPEAMRPYHENVAEANRLREALNPMPGEVGHYGTVPVSPRTKQAPVSGRLVEPRRVAAVPKISGLERRPAPGPMPRVEPINVAGVPKLHGLEHVIGGKPPVSRPRPLPAATVSDVPHAPGLEPGSEELAALVAKSLGPARRLEAADRAAMREERALRKGRFERSKLKAGSGQKGFRAGMRELRGEFPRSTFENLRNGTLAQSDVEQLVKRLQNHPELGWWEKNVTGPKALLAAFEEGRRPTKGEIEILRKAFDEPVAQVLGHKTFARRVGENALGVVNLPRALQASIDVSFPGRQGIGVLAMKPKVWAKGFGPQFKGLASERYYQAKIDEFHQDPYFERSQRAGVKYTELGRSAADREEPFVSKFSENIPGIRHSARAYTLYGDYVRLHLFKELVRKAERKGINVESSAELRAIARVVNTFSGRGGGKLLKQVSPVANALFFAPQYTQSRINMLNPLWYASLGRDRSGAPVSNFARNEALKAGAKLGLGAGAVLGAGAFAGAQVGLDPRNADFLKLRHGNTRFDILAGLPQYPRLVSQLATGKIVSSTTGKTLSLGPGYGKLTRFDVLRRFAEGKLAPPAALVDELLHGSTYDGQPLAVKREIAQHLMPFVVQDALDLYHQQRKGHSLPAAAGLAAAGYGISATGLGMQTYGPRPPKGTSPKDLRSAQAHQDVHLNNLVRKGILPRKHRAQMREALDVYDKRNQFNKAIDATTKGKPIEREHQKLKALLDLLLEHKMIPPGERAKARRYYSSKGQSLTPKELQRQREWIWRNYGPSEWITWYRDKAGAND